MANQIDIIMQGQNRTAAAFQQVRRDLDGLARTAKGADLTPKLNTAPLDKQLGGVDTKLSALRGKATNITLDANTAPAKARITELQNQITRLQGQAKVGTITLEGVANLRSAQGELRGLQDVLSGAQDQAGGLAGVMSGRLATAFTIAGVAAAAMKLGGLFMEFGALGETVGRSEKYFTAFSGSAQLAAGNLAAMQRATEGALSTQEAMNSGASILGMGLAKNADELEQFARMAVLLGGNTRTATEAINEFQLLIANQSILRLDTFGISGAKVRERIEELMSATAGLTREQAFLDAVMEEGTRKMSQLEAEGVRAGTTQERLSAQTKNLKAELASLVAQPYTVVIEQVVKGVSGLNDMLQGAQNASLAFDITAGTEERLTAIAERMTYLNDLRERFANGENIYRFNDAGAARELAELQGITAQLQVYGAAAGNVRSKLDAYLAASLAVSDAQGRHNAAMQLGTREAQDLTQAEISTAQRARDLALAAYQAAEGIARSAQTADNSTASMLDLAGAYDRVAAAAAGASVTPTTGTFTVPSQTRGGLMTEWARHFEQPAQNNFDIWLEKKNAAELKAAKSSATAAKSAASEWNAAFQQVAGRIEGYLSQGMASAEGLFDLTPDMMQPGANGAFENIFRALDVAKLGTASPWAEKLGLTQEAAAKIGADFQRGIFSEGVMGLIDTNALVNEAQMAAMAEKSKTAFVNAIAQKAGVGTSVVSALFGLESKSGAQGETSSAQKAVDGAMQQVAGALGDTVKGADFAGRIIGYGDAIWGYFEQGIVEKAQASTALQRAIAAMVSAALAGQGGGSVGGAVRNAGGQ